MPDVINTPFATIERSVPFYKYAPNISLTAEETRAADMLTNIIKGKDREKLSNMEFMKEIIDLAETQDITNVFPNKILYTKIFDKLKDTLKKLGLTNVDKIAGKVMDATFGYGKIGALLRDPELEEIMINCEDKPVFVFHREYGMARTNIFYDKNELQKLISKIAKTVGKDFNDNYPLLDARLMDGSRANATFTSITPFGYSLTIRKFSSEPLSIIKLINNGTISSEVAAFLWLCIEGLELSPQNILVIGGAGSGKTTMLMALTSFIRYSNRIVTIEDTPEINLSSRENWVSLEARAKTPSTPEVSMDDLLKNALRMRPDRLIVGEVRGEEAQTLFTAMDTGHRGILGTLHANNSKETIVRLKNRPMEVPENSIALLDLIINIKKQNNYEGKVTRKVIEVTEIDKMDNTILLSNVYERVNIDDEIRKTNVPARTIEKLAKAIGVTKTEISDEITLRKNIINWIHQNQIYDYEEVTKVIQRYYEDPEKLIHEAYGTTKQ